MNKCLDVCLHKGKCWSSPLCFTVDSFLENLESRNKGYGSPGPANGQSPSSGSQSPIVPPSGASTGSSSPSTPQAPIASQTVPQSPSMTASSPPPPSAAASTTASPTVDSKPPAQSPEHLQPSGPSAGPALQKRSFISRWFGLPPAETTPSANQGTSESTSCQNVWLWLFRILLTSLGTRRYKPE